MEKYSEYKDSGVKWLGEIPSHWNMLALKHILKLKKDVVGRRSSQYDLLSLTLKGVVKRDMENPEGKFPASFDTYQAVEPKDFIFCNFDNEETPRAVGLSPYKGMITGAYDVLSRKNPKLTDGFLIYYFLYIDDAKRFKPLYKGLRKTVPFDSFMSYKIPVPSLKEQDAIVSYLDTATAKIDAAITQQQKMIDLLNERKQIIINRAVTKGLNPDVKMKDSGVEWIGEVPENWEVRRIKYILRESNVRSVDGHESSYSLSKSKGLIPFTDKDNLTQARINNIGAKIIKPGEIVFNRFKARLFAVSDVEAAVSPDYAIYQKITKCDLHYLVYLFGTKMYREEFDRIAQGVGDGFSRLYTEDLFSIYAIFPNEDEQKQIVRFIRKNTENIDLYICQCEKTISLLQERKQIIINEVVTGKVKITINK